MAQILTVLTEAIKVLFMVWYIFHDYIMYGVIVHMVIKWWARRVTFPEMFLFMEMFNT